MTRGAATGGLLLVLAGAALSASASQASPVPGSGLTPLERRGRQIYVTGVSPSGHPLTATLGGSTDPVPASVLPCAGCHGFDGKGRPEGGVAPPDVTWEALTKPYGRVSPGGRKTPAYTAALEARAITAGIDAAGNALGPAMPRYALDPADLGALLAYLARLGSAPERGVSPSEIAVAVFGGGPGPAGDAARAAWEVLSAFAAEANGQGGFFGRRLRIGLADPNAPRGPVAGDVLAAVVALPGASSTDLASWCDAEGIPCIDAFGAFPADGDETPRYAFSVFPGLEQQARTLVELVAGRPDASSVRVAVVSSGAAVPLSLVDSVEALCRTVGLASVVRVPASSEGGTAAVVASLAADGTNALLLLAPPSVNARILQEASRIGFLPAVYVPAPLAGRDVLSVPTPLRSQTFVALPSCPAPSGSEGSAEFQSFLDRNRVPANLPGVRQQAWAAARVLAEGLRRAGRDVSRERLVVALEGLYDFETGVTPPVSFGPRRRTGVEKACVARP